MIEDGDQWEAESVRERRCSTRLPVVNIVWYKILEDDWDAQESSQEGVSRMCDISHHGIGLLVTQDLPIGKHVFVEATLQKFSVSAVGVVVFKKQEGKGYYRIGIRIKIMPPNDKMNLDSFIQSHDKD